MLEGHSPSEGLLTQVPPCHSEGPWQAGGMAHQEPQEAQGTAWDWQASGSPAEKRLSPSGPEGEHESGGYPCSAEGRPRPEQARSCQVQGRDYWPLLSSLGGFIWNTVCPVLGPSRPRAILTAWRKSRAGPQRWFSMEKSRLRGWNCSLQIPLRGHREDGGRLFSEAYTAKGQEPTSWSKGRADWA